MFHDEARTDDPYDRRASCGIPVAPQSKGSVMTVIATELPHVVWPARCSCAATASLAAVLSDKGREARVPICGRHRWLYPLRTKDALGRLVLRVEAIV